MRFILTLLLSLVFDTSNNGMHVEGGISFHPLFCPSYHVSMSRKHYLLPFKFLVTAAWPVFCLML